MVKPNVDFDAVVEEWLGSQAGFKRYVNATENLYSAFTEGWCGPRSGPARCIRRLPYSFALRIRLQASPSRRATF